MSSRRNTAGHVCEGGSTGWISIAASRHSPLAPLGGDVAVLTGFRPPQEASVAGAGSEAARSSGRTPADSSDPHLRDRLKTELERLPDRLRMPVVLHDIEGFTHREIGEMLDIPQGTSKARLFEARARLREALAGVAAEQ